MDVLRTEPGGYLYWVDVDAESVRLVRPKNFTKEIPASEQTVASMKKPYPTYDALWTSHLDRHFSECGLVSTSLEHAVINPAYTSLHNVHAILLLEDFATSMLDPGSGRAKGLYKRIAKLNDEMKEGVGLLNDYIVAVGQKAA
ncbi:hypothetical protein MMC25_008116 [Agyrium rufum]|nr:hypothetical protein [Agyrium rufum]